MKETPNDSLMRARGRRPARPGAATTRRCSSCGTLTSTCTHAVAAPRCRPVRWRRWQSALRPSSSSSAVGRPAGRRSPFRTPCGRRVVPARAPAAGLPLQPQAAPAGGCPAGRAFGAGVRGVGGCGGAGIARARTGPPEGGAGAQPAGARGSHFPRSFCWPAWARILRWRPTRCRCRWRRVRRQPGWWGNPGIAAAQARRRAVVAPAGGLRAAQHQCCRGRAGRAGAGLDQGPRRAPPCGRGHRRRPGAVLQPHRCTAAAGAACHRQHVASGYPHPCHPEGSADIGGRAAGAASRRPSAVRRGWRRCSA